jgi:co-chaperonin GroES (HSP10)
MDRKETEGYQPLDTGILIKRTESPSETPGGIHIPEAYRSKTHTGIILAIGPNVVNEWAIPGAEVMFQAYGYAEVMLNENPVVVLDESDVVLIRPAKGTG